VHAAVHIIDAKLQQQAGIINCNDILSSIKLRILMIALNTRIVRITKKRLFEIPFLINSFLI
jgi:hypothetical protein